MTSVDLITVRLVFAGTQPRPAPHLLRGAIASQFPDEPLFHQHEGEGLLYRFPRIQYRWDEEGAILVGLAEGATMLLGVEWPGMELRLGNHHVQIQEAICEFRRFEVRCTPHLLRYRLAAPWLPLSQENYARYQQMNSLDQAYERDRLARGGILLGLRGMGVEVQERLFVAVEDARPIACPYKSVELLGFLGRILVNVELPAGFAFGRAVSHGFGWIIPEEAATRGREPV